MVRIRESDMCFGEYSKEEVFPIEAYSQSHRGLASNGVKSCEFILKRADSLYFVEAKSSCPNQISADSTEEKRRKYHAYIADITDKMRHSLTLYASILLNRHDAEGVPEGFLGTDLAAQKMKLVLVVKNARESWLVPLKEKLEKELKWEAKIWNLTGFYVINEEQARKKHLVM